MEAASASSFSRETTISTLELTFEAGTAESLFEGAFDQWYDLSPDGSFVMLTRPSAELDEIRVIINWLSELAQRVPTN